MSGPGPAGSRSPSPTLPLSYLVTAVAAFVLACAAVPSSPLSSPGTTTTRASPLSPTR